MATLEEALLGLNYTGADTGYGIAAQTLGQMTPQLINPYGSTGQAVGISLGSILLQSLLGYQARSQAAQDTLQANTLANQMMSMTTPQARTDFIGGLEDPMQQSRLSTLATALTAQEQARKLKTSTLLDELRTKGEFEMGPLGTQLYQRDLDKQAAIQEAVTQRVLDAERLRQAGKGDGTDSETQKLRREFNTRPEIKGYSKIRDAAAVVQLAEKDPSAVASMELAKRAVHLIEPGLAALQGEVNAVENSASIPGAFKAKLKKALIGEGGLDESVRKGIIDMAKRSYNVAAQSYEETRKFYEDEALAAGLQPSRISSFGPAKPFEYLNIPAAATVQTPTMPAVAQPQAQNKQSQLNDILNQIKQTTDPARIAELKRQATAVMQGQ